MTWNNICAISLFFRYCGGMQVVQWTFLNTSKGSLGTMTYLCKNVDEDEIYHARHFIPCFKELHLFLEEVDFEWSNL